MKKLLFVIPLIATLALPSFAFANSSLPTSQWNFYQYADQTAPSQTTQFNIQVKNTTSGNIDAISASVPNLNACMIVTAVYAQNAADNSNLASTVPQTFPSATCTSGVSGFNIGSSGSASINLKPGATLNIFLNVDISCITAGGYPSCDPDPTHTTQGDWQNVHYYHYTSGGGLTSYNAEGNTTVKITNTPNPMQQPLDWGRSNPYAAGLSQSGINDPTQIHGLFPAGPVDTLILLPVAVATQLYDTATGGVVTPTASLFGHTFSFPSGQSLYTALGSSFSNTVTAISTFVILYFWLKGLYGRLQRATQLQSTANDTWGVL